jgi:hypothetical protein
MHMKQLALLFIATNAYARPLNDADFAKLAPPKDEPTKDLCIVARRFNTDGTSMVVLSYAEHGRITKKSAWLGDQSHAYTTAYTWAKDKLVHIDTDAATADYAYDTHGLLASTANITLEWHVKPVGAPVRALWPDGLMPRSGLPSQLPFTGTVIMMVGSAKRTYSYGPQGTLAPDRCTLDDKGRVATCDDGDAYQWSQTGELLGLTNQRVGRELMFRWDDKHRLVRQQQLAAGAVIAESRWEYRCNGVTTDVVDWWTR